MARQFNDSWARGLFAANPFQDLQRDLNRLFGDAFRRGSPRVDVRETEDEVCVVADVPGVAPADLDVRIDGSLLTITAERHGDAERADENYHVMERTRGLMRRTVQLPFSPQPDDVRARYENGVLTVHLPKASTMQRGHRVDVQAGQGTASTATSSPARGSGSVDIDLSSGSVAPSATAPSSDERKPAEGVA